MDINALDKKFFTFIFLLNFFHVILTEKYEPVTHVIFDLDGLLVDTEKIYYQSGRELCAKYGKEFTIAIKQKIMGTTELRTAEIIIENLNLPVTPEDYIKQVHEIFTQRLPNSNLMPGVERLFRHLHRNNIPFAIATGSSYEMYLLKVQKHKEFFTLIDHITAASTDSDVKQGKPAPDVFLICAKRFKDQPHPSKCLVFEDASNGITAARRAGMQVVMVPDDQFVSENDPCLIFKDASGGVIAAIKARVQVAWVPNQHHLSGASNQEATLVLKTLEDFNPELFGLPVYSETKG